MNTQTSIQGNLTKEQLIIKVSAAAKAWLKANGYNDVSIQCIRGTFHATNGDNYMMSAKYILESATGLDFNHMNAGMARLNSKYSTFNNILKAIQSATN